MTNPNLKAVTNYNLLGHSPKRYELTLECGHVTRSTRMVKAVSCGECREAKR